jgi:hypothetical protein
MMDRTSSRISPVVVAQPIQSYQMLPLTFGRRRRRQSGPHHKDRDQLLTLKCPDPKRSSCVGAWEVASYRTMLVVHVGGSVL